MHTDIRDWKQTTTSDIFVSVCRIPDANTDFHTYKPTSPFVDSTNGDAPFVDRNVANPEIIIRSRREIESSTPQIQEKDILVYHSLQEDEEEEDAPVTA